MNLCEVTLFEEDFRGLPLGMASTYLYTASLIRIELWGA